MSTRCPSAGWDAALSPAASSLLPEEEQQHENKLKKNKEIRDLHEGQRIV